MNTRNAEELALRNSVIDGDLTKVRDLVALGCDPDAVISRACLSPLMIAAADGNVEMVELLLELGANINEQLCEEMTPLLYAIRGPLHIARHSEKIKFNAVIMSLLSHGADVTLSDYDLWTPLAWAIAAEKELPIVEMIIKAGSDVNAESRDGITVVDIARKCRDSYRVPVLQLLARYGAFVGLSQ